MALLVGGFLVLVASVGLGVYSKLNVEENFGNMLILVASMSGAAGVMLMGMSAVVSELKRIAELLESPGVASGRPSASMSADSSASGQLESYDGDFVPMSATPVPTTWGDEPRRSRNDPRRDRGGRRTPDLRPVPDTLEPMSSIFEPDRGRSRDRSSVLSAAAAERAVSAALAEDQNITLMKSGVVDGMKYSLYSDGSIEAQMPEGMLRFSSLEELRSHLNRRS